MDFNNVNRTNMSDSIIEQIITKITQGELKIGDKLPTEKEFEKLIGVGRSTVREALKSLEVLGLLERKKTGTVVCEPKGSSMISLLQCFVALSSVDVKQIIDLRIALEPFFIRNMAEQITDEDVNRLELILENCDVTKAEENAAFHEELAKISKNNVYDLIFRMLIPAIMSIQKVSLGGKMGVSGENIQDHYSVLNELKNKNGEKASALMKEHLRKLRNEFE